MKNAIGEAVRMDWSPLLWESGVEWSGQLVLRKETRTEGGAKHAGENGREQRRKQTDLIIKRKRLKYTHVPFL